MLSAFVPAYALLFGRFIFNLYAYAYYITAIAAVCIMFRAWNLFYFNLWFIIEQGTYVEGIKEEVVLSPAHALSLIASGEGIVTFTFCILVDFYKETFLLWYIYLSYIFLRFNLFLVA